MKYGISLNPTSTPQTQPIPGKNQVANNAGGYTYSLTPLKHLERFLILGSEKGSYYASETKLTLENAQNALKCIKNNGIEALQLAINVSDEGRAPKNDAAIFILALAIKFGNEDTRKLAYDSVPKICRTGTHLFTLAQTLSDLGKGWGRGLKKAISKWYTEPPINSVVYQLAKYQSRNGWSNKDLLRLSHPKTSDRQLNAAFKWALSGEVTEGLPSLLKGFELAKKETSKAEIIKLINEYNLTRECIPTQFLNDAEIWEALLVNMPLTALIRNLGNMTKCGLLTPSSNATKLVVSKLSDGEYIQKSRVHPITILLAMKTYSSGHSMKGNGTWNTVPKIVSTLDAAFYKAFKNIEPTGKSFYIGLDVSGSMRSNAAGTPLTCAEGAAAMAMTIMKTESSYYTFGFCDHIKDLKLNDAMDLETVLMHTSRQNFGSTDCSLPMQHALKEGFDVDVFVVITDNETYAGRTEHPSQALIAYRKKMNKPNAKLIVMAMTPTPFTIADPSDSGMLDMVGFDSNVPQIISEFVKID